MRAAVVAVALAVCLGVIVIRSQAAAGETTNPYYCGDIVPTQTDCAKDPGWSWDWYDNWFNVNHAYVPNGKQGQGPWVCEHTYVYGTGYTASRQCDAGWVSSDPLCPPGDLWRYYPQIELSGHVGNDTTNQIITVWGHAYVESETPWVCE
jgi:hypothetical protein